MNRRGILAAAFTLAIAIAIPFRVAAWIHGNACCVYLGVYGSTTANGWTTFIASNGTQPSGLTTKIVYVSAQSGSDSNNGLTVNTPVQTIAHALTLITTGHPDWLLLKKGDTWTDEQFGYMNKVGYSAQEPMVFGSYDPAYPGVVNPVSASARPLLKTKWNVATDPALGSFRGGGSNFAVVGINFYDYTRDPSNPSYNSSTAGNEHGTIGFANQAADPPINWILVEDCLTQWSSGSGIGGYYGSNVAYAKANTVIIRRNVITNIYQTDAAGHSEGFFESGVANLIVEENIFDQVGYVPGITGVTRNPFSHSLYNSVYNDPALVRGNIFSRSGAQGTQLRSGGTAYDNFYTQNPIVGFGRTYPLNFYNNVMSEGILVAGVGDGWGISILGSGDGSSIHNNILSNVITVSPAFSIKLSTYDRQITSLTLANPAVITLDADVQGDADGIVQNGNAVTFTNSGGSLPASIVSGTVYYVVNASANGLVFSISATVGGTPISTLSQSTSGTTTMHLQTQNSSVTNNIIYHWFGAPTDNGINSTISGNTVDGGGYPAPSRTIGTYAASLGQPATIDGFMSVALAMDKSNWNPAYTANNGVNPYIRAGFGL